MNTSTNAMTFNDDRPHPARTAPHATHKFKLLLKREFWEHKGGFFWAPLWAGAISLLLTLMAAIVAEVAARRAIAAGKFDGDSLSANGVNINGLDLSALTSHMDAEAMRNLSNGIDISMFMSSLWPLIAFTFVVFFYCLGSLYDERKDRSVLFWKSLPVSDRDTVLSKAASALLVAPVIAIGTALASMFGFLLMISAFVLLHHGNPIELIWGPGNPLKLAASMLATIPVYALWALPTVGWLLLCSAWAKSKPFLWAIMIPVFAGIFISWFDVMNLFNLESTWFWKNIVARGLLSAVPGSWFDAATFNNAHITSSEAARKFGGLHQALSLQATYSVLLTKQLWIGAAAGAAMIFGAIRLRRWRDEG